MVTAVWLKKVCSHNSNPHHSSLDFGFKFFRSLKNFKNTQKTMHNNYHDPSRKNLARLTSVLQHSIEVKICLKMYQQTMEKKQTTNTLNL